MGYVGPSVARHLRAALSDARLVGDESAFFAHCLTGAPILPERLFDEQLFGDTRDLPRSVLGGIDA